MIPVTMRSERTESARRTTSPSCPTVDHPALAEAQGEAARYLERVLTLQARYRAGTRISHPTWGEGIVLDSKIQDDDEIVDVVFESVGIKRLAASLANLTII